MYEAERLRVVHDDVWGQDFVVHREIAKLLPLAILLTCSRKLCPAGITFRAIGM